MIYPREAFFFSGITGLEACNGKGKTQKMSVQPVPPLGQSPGMGGSAPSPPQSALRPTPGSLQQPHRGFGALLQDFTLFCFYQVHLTLDCLSGPIGTAFVGFFGWQAGDKTNRRQLPPQPKKNPPSRQSHKIWGETASTPPGGSICVLLPRPCSPANTRQLPSSL